MLEIEKPLFLTINLVPEKQTRAQATIAKNFQTTQAQSENLK